MVDSIVYSSRCISASESVATGLHRQNETKVIFSTGNASRRFFTSVSTESISWWSFTLISNFAFRPLENMVLFVNIIYLLEFGNERCNVSKLEGTLGRFKLVPPTDTCGTRRRSSNHGQKEKLNKKVSVPHSAFSFKTFQTGI